MPLHRKKQVNRPCAFTINQLCAFFMKMTELLLIIESRGTLDYVNQRKSLDQSQQLSKWP